MFKTFFCHRSMVSENPAAFTGSPRAAGAVEMGTTGDPLPPPVETAARPGTEGSSRPLYSTPEEAIRADRRERESLRQKAAADAARPDWRCAPRVLTGIPIRVVASDADGRHFVEDTVTAMVSATGARISLSRPLLDNDTIVIRNLRNGIEGEFRVVGMCSPVFGGRAEWGLESVDATKDIWGLTQLAEGDAGLGVKVECGGCEITEEARLTSVEKDVLALTGLISRYCRRCHEITRWRRGRA